jgi:hypothetical protein
LVERVGRAVHGGLVVRRGEEETRAWLTPAVQYATDSGLRQLPVQRNGIRAACGLAVEREHRKAAAMRDGAGPGHAITESLHEMRKASTQQFAATVA